MPDRDDRLAARYLAAAVELLTAARAGLLSDERLREIGQELPEGSGAGVAANVVNVAAAMRTFGPERGLQHAGLTAARIRAGLDQAED